MGTFVRIVTTKRSSFLSLKHFFPPLWSIRKLIKEGGKNALSSRNWIALWLQFSQKFMNSTYHNLSRYSDDLESLFTTLISNINVDEEVAKERFQVIRISAEIMVCTIHAH